MDSFRSGEHLRSQGAGVGCAGENGSKIKWCSTIHPKTEALSAIANYGVWYIHPVSLMGLHKITNVLVISLSIFIQIYHYQYSFRSIISCLLGASSGTNTKVEVMALWGLLWFTNFLDIPNLHVLDDSKIIIDYVCSQAHINKSSLQGWLKQIKSICCSLKNPTIQHISRILNSEADRLLKNALDSDLDGLHVNIKLQKTWLDAGNFPIPW